jgi:hypothetical protein
VLAQGAPPPCELEANTLSGHEGATMHEYRNTDSHGVFCHLAHETAGHLNVIPDGESCEIDCDRGYAGRATNKLSCSSDGQALTDDFTCTRKSSINRALPCPAATRTALSCNDDRFLTSSLSTRSVRRAKLQARGRQRRVHALPRRPRDGEGGSYE